MLIAEAGKRRGGWIPSARSTPKELDSGPRSSGPLHW